MPRVIPTCGYPSRQSAIEGLHAAGMSVEEIAQKTGVSRGTVRVVLCHANRGRTRPGVTERTVRVPVDILDRLRIRANARGISVNELVRRLLDSIADDDLADCILDDGENHA
jgi:hypothetical protein